MRSFRISDKFFLVIQDVDQKAPPAKPAGVNRFVVVDRSGSMQGVMPRMRDQLKQKILGLMNEADTLTLLVFSSRGEFRTVLEAVQVATLKDLREVHRKIDVELRATNLTGFVDPLNEVTRIAGKLKGPSELWFMSDGYDNQHSRAEILKAMSGVSKLMSATTIVEFGNYADRGLLAEMATVAGGRHIHAERLQDYEPVFEKTMSGSAPDPRVSVAIKGDPIQGLAFGLQKDNILSFSVTDGKIAVPGGVGVVAWLSPAAVGESSPFKSFGAGLTSPVPEHAVANAMAYAALSLFSVRMKSDIVLPLLKALGDVRLIKQYALCFGKQRYAKFATATREAAFGAGRWAEGYDPNAVPPDDGFTLWNLLSIITEEPGTTLLIDKLDYRRIGLQAIDAADKLTKEEAEKVAELETKIDAVDAKVKGSKVTKVLKAAVVEKSLLQEEIAAILASKKESPKFEADPMPNGIAITGLVFNEERPNISIQTRRTGRVKIREVVDAAVAHEAGLAVALEKLPQTIESFQFRNYTMIKDGLVNVDELPIRMTGATWAKLTAANMPIEIAKIESTSGDDLVPDFVTATIFLRQLPVINRAMVKSTRGQDLFNLELALARSRAAQKVLNGYAKAEGVTKKSAGFEEKYGKEASAWLKQNLGLTDYSGYNPKRTLADPVDFYMGKFLTSIVYERGAIDQIAAGKTAQGRLDSLPSLKEAQEARAKGGKLSGAKALMVGVINEIEKSKGHEPDGYDERIKTEQERHVKETRRLLREKAKSVFTLIVSQSWFTDDAFVQPVEVTLKGTKENHVLMGNTHTFDVGGTKYDFVVGLEEQKILI